VNLAGHQAIVCGASRGLGAALVEAMIEKGITPVVGVSRGRRDGRPLGRDAGRYREDPLDLSRPDAGSVLKRLVDELAPCPLIAVYNAAVLRSELSGTGPIDIATAAEVNAVGVAGFTHFLGAVQHHLLAHGGVLVGVSSFAAYAPPAREPRVAYPATKAYLDMALRTLRHAWRGRVTVVTIHLGHIGGTDETAWARWIRPSYAAAARHILRRLSQDRSPDEINYTLPYTIVYKYVLRHVPDSLYFRVFSRDRSSHR
jgi:NAD(P)-dependent dehydrogenase (short-subunit alcohol dehydrogenase family)